MISYLDILEHVYKFGDDVKGRNGVTRKVFGQTYTHNMNEGFPLLTTKRMAFQQCLAEFLCFIRGYDTLKDFHSLGCTIWDANANAPSWKPKHKGWLGNIYGVQWRSFTVIPGDPDFNVDQLTLLVKNIKKDPYSRRHLITAWNPAELDQMCLPPCHTEFQVCISQDGKLNLRFSMRSVDLFLGLPFNICSYGLMMLMLCHKTGYKPGILLGFLTDAHIYKTHFEQVEEQLRRIPFGLPELSIDPELPEDCKFEDYEKKHFPITNYFSHPSIEAEMSV
ncbi:thymidylate synthase [Patescibacteria group bacterium]|nr:thymidylate synthase [Patescibacteria group bacterium]